MFGNYKRNVYLDEMLIAEMLFAFHLIRWNDMKMICFVFTLIEENIELYLLFFSESANFYEINDYQTCPYN